MADPTSSNPPAKVPHPRRRKISVSTIIILILAAIAGLTYYLGTPPVPSSVGNTTTTIVLASPHAIVITIPDGVGTTDSKSRFVPPNLTVVIGVNNTIVWTDNDTYSAHDVISVSVPPNGEQWDFENMTYPRSYSVTLTATGNYAYEMFLPYVVEGMITVKG